MSTHAVPPDAEPQIAVLIHDYLRPATDYGPDGYTFDPDLTFEETAQFDVLVRIARSGLNMDEATYGAVRSQMQTLRSLRQMGRSAFMALTAAERDRMLYDASIATTTVFLSILRDE